MAPLRHAIISFSFLINCVSGFLVAPRTTSSLAHHGRLGSLTATEKADGVTADMLADFVSQIYTQEAKVKRGSVEFLQYDDTYVLPREDDTSEDSGGVVEERETLLFIPGLDFSGVSAVGQYPELAQKYDVWWCRVSSDDRTLFSDLADTIAAFVAQDLSASGKPITLLGESFGGLLTVAVALRLKDADAGKLQLPTSVSAEPIPSPPEPAQGPTPFPAQRVRGSPSSVGSSAAYMDALGGANSWEESIQGRPKEQRSDDRPAYDLGAYARGRDGEASASGGVVQAVPSPAPPVVDPPLRAGAAPTPATAAAALLRGVVLVNPATSFDRTPWGILGGALASLPGEQSLSEIATAAGVPVPVVETLGSGSERLRDAIAAVQSNNDARLEALLRGELPVSPYGVAAAAVLGATVPDVMQIVRGARGVVDDVLSDAGNAARFERASLRSEMAIGALNALANRIPPETLRFRLEEWLAAGCLDVAPRLEIPSEETDIETAENGGHQRQPKSDFARYGIRALVLGGEEDRMLPSAGEAARLATVLGSRETVQAKVLGGIGHAALDDRLPLLRLIDESPLASWRLSGSSATDKAPAATTKKDWVRDFERPNATAVAEASESLKNLRAAVSPIFLSTDGATGRTIRGLGGVPLPRDIDRPVLIVGNHQLLALDLGLLVEQFLTETDTLPRGLAHPVTFRSSVDGNGMDSVLGAAQRTRGRRNAELFDDVSGPLSPLAALRRLRSTANAGIMRRRGHGNEEQSRSEDGGGTGIAFNGIGSFEKFGAVPVTPRNFFKLLESNEMVLLFPGGVREANHGKNEEYKLFWPKKADFVAMATRFDAVIVPFGAIGAADTASIALDSRELEKVPVVGDRLVRGAKDTPAARRGMWARGKDDFESENFAFPLVVPNPRGPDRFYFKFGTPLDTRSIDHKDSAAMDAAYAEVKHEVERSIEELLAGREKDPYRPLPPRLLYEKLNSRQAPTFPLGAGQTPKRQTPANSAGVSGNAPSIDAFTQAFVKGTSREV